MGTFFKALLNGILAATGALVAVYFLFNNQHLAFTTSEISGATIAAVVGFIGTYTQARRSKNKAAL